MSLAARAVVWLLASWAGLRAPEAVLRGEVVYTTIGVIVLAMVLAADRARADEAVHPAR